jgi:hypothetical protein
MMSNSCDRLTHLSYDPSMGDPVWTDVLFGLLALLFFSRLWLVARRSHGSSWGTHVLAAIVVMLAVWVIGVMPFLLGGSPK